MADESLQAKPRPRPSRKALDLAEQKLAEQQRAIGALMTQGRKAGEGEAAKLQVTVDKARRKYEGALDQWRGEGG